MQAGCPDQVDQAIAEEEAETRVDHAVSLSEIDATDGATVEAQEWVVDTDGNVVLTASTSAGTPHSPQLRPIQCPVQ